MINNHKECLALPQDLHKLELICKYIQNNYKTICNDNVYAQLFLALMQMSVFLCLPAKLIITFSH